MGVASKTPHRPGKEYLLKFHALERRIERAVLENNGLDPEIHRPESLVQSFPCNLPEALVVLYQVYV